MTLEAPSNDDIGVYQVDLIVENIAGYTTPTPGGNLSPISYNFEVTVNPCPLASITGEADFTINYQIGESGFTSQTYGGGTQSPECNYELDSVITSSLPSLPSGFITDNPTSDTLTFT